MYMNPELRKKSWPWHHPSFGEKLTPEGRKLLEDCGVPAEDVDAHVHRVRDEAWDIFPFPCVGEFWFLEFGITHHPRLKDIIALLQDGPTHSGHQDSKPTKDKETGSNNVVSSILQKPNARRLLDLGTCVGQDLRALRAAGAPANTLFGTDLFPGFEAVGHLMFRDRETSGRNFFQSDILDDSPESPLKTTTGHWDIVTITMFFHQFDAKVGLEMATRVIPLLKKVPGSMVVGNNTGETIAREIPLMAPFTGEGPSTSVMRHSRESMRDMWEKAIDQAEPNDDSASRESRWDIWCDYDHAFTTRREREDKDKVKDPRFFTGGQQRRVMFCIRRL